MTDLQPSATAATDPARVWTFADVAAFLAVTEAELDRIVAAHPSFPEPVLLAPTIGGRWWPQAVIDWFATIAGWHRTDLTPEAATAPTAMRRPVQPKAAPHTTPGRRVSHG